VIEHAPHKPGASNVMLFGSTIAGPNAAISANDPADPWQPSPARAVQAVIHGQIGIWRGYSNTALDDQ